MNNVNSLILQTCLFYFSAEDNGFRFVAIINAIVLFSIHDEFGFR